MIQQDCVIPPSSLDVDRDRCQWEHLYDIAGAIETSNAVGARMASFNIGSSQLRGHLLGSIQLGRCTNCVPRHTTYLTAQSRCVRRQSASSVRSFASNSGKRPRFSQRLGEALRNTKIQWYQIPVGLGIGFLGLVQFYKVSAREKEKQKELDDPQRQPKRRPKIRPEGPW